MSSFDPTLVAVEEWYRCAYAVAAIGGAIGLSEALRVLFGLHPEFSRKTVHILVAVGVLLAPWLFQSGLPLAVLSLLFALVNWIALRRGWLKGIHGTNRVSFGTVAFPLSLLLLTLAFWHQAPRVVALSMAVFSVGDALAAIVGESVPRPHRYQLSRDQKSLEGSATMLLTVWLLTAAGISLYLDVGMPFDLTVAGVALVIALIATAWESLSARGLDNLAGPVVVGVLLTALVIVGEAASLSQFLLGGACSLIAAILSYSWRLLSPGGSVAMFILACFIFGFGGWVWTIPILTFFLLSSGLSRVGAARKKEVEGVFEKGSLRDQGQVAANGGVAGVLVVVQSLFPDADLTPFFVGSVAAVTADTWGTEVGILTRGRTFAIIGWRSVPAGTNGGVSLMGSLAGITGAFIISAVSAALTGDRALLIVGVSAGVIGATVDSVVGSTVQAQFRCVVCGKSTEKEVHCFVPGRHERGFAWMRNDAVNWVCAATGALAAGGTYMIALS